MPTPPQEPVQDILDRLAADEPLVEEAVEPSPAAEVDTSFEPSEEESNAVLEAIEEAEFPEIVAAGGVEAPPVSGTSAQASSRPAVTTGMAPAPAASGAVSSPVPAQGSAPAAESVPVARVTEAQAVAESLAEPAPEAPAAKAKKAEAKKAPAKRAAKATKAPAMSTGTAGGPAEKASAAPRKAAARPRPRPFLEPTPDLHNHEMTPVRNGSPQPPAPPVAPPPMPPSPFAVPGVQPPTAQTSGVRPPESPKRKPWWRPGG